VKSNPHPSHTRGSALWLDVTMNIELLNLRVIQVAYLLGIVQLVRILASLLGLVLGVLLVNRAVLQQFRGRMTRFRPTCRLGGRLHPNRAIRFAEALSRGLQPVLGLAVPHLPHHGCVLLPTARVTGITYPSLVLMLVLPFDHFVLLDLVSSPLLLRAGSPPLASRGVLSIVPRIIIFHLIFVEHALF